MPYPELMIAPLRKELTRLGIRELRTPEEVDAFMDAVKPTTGTAPMRRPRHRTAA